MEKYYTGRKRITIPVSRQNFDKDPVRYIKHYLASVISQNSVNKEQAEELKNIYKGVQSIWNKIRLNTDERNNNQIEINHILFRPC